MIGRTPPQIRPGLTFNGWLIVIVEAFSFSVEAFLRRGFGCRYIDRQAALAPMLMSLFVVLSPPDDQAPMLCFLLAYLVMAAWQWTLARWRLLRGDDEHSRYSGWPRCLRAHLAHREHRIKKYFEPFAVICISGLIGEHSPCMAAYLAVSAACLFVSGQRAEGWMRRRVIDMNDAVVEQQHVAERFQTLNQRS